MGLGSFFASFVLFDSNNRCWLQKLENLVPELGVKEDFGHCLVRTLQF